MKKFALLVYPEFSLQEVMNLSRLFGGIMTSAPRSFHPAWTP